MITKIKLKNYKSFTDITIDLSGKNGSPKNLIILYGENGSGKTNIINVFDTLSDTFNTMLLKEFLMDTISDNAESITQDAMKKILSITDISNIIKNSKTFGSSDKMIIEITFCFHNKTGIYTIEFDNSNIIHEKLEYVINKNRSVFFNILSSSDVQINENVFSKDVIIELKSLLIKYWGKHSFMSLLYYKNKDWSDSYFDNNINDSMKSVLEYFYSMSYYIVENKNKWGNSVTSQKLITSLVKGTINECQLKSLKRTEYAVKEILTKSYNDIKDVKYIITSTNDNKISYELIISKLLTGKIYDIPFSSESCGTKNLINLIPFLLSTSTNYVTAIDEIDNGLHDILFEKIFDNLIQCNQGQLIITTHNTSFINNYNFKDNIYFICIDGNGYKEVKAITDFGFRIQEKSNTLTHYLNSEFNIRPWHDINIDFSSIYKNIDQIDK